VWSDLSVIRDAISVLATHGWQMSLDEEAESDEDAEREDPLAPVQTRTTIQTSTGSSWSGCQ